MDQDPVVVVMIDGKEEAVVIDSWVVSCPPCAVAVSKLVDRVVACYECRAEDVNFAGVGNERILYEKFGVVTDSVVVYPLSGVEST